MNGYSINLLHTNQTETFSSLKSYKSILQNQPQFHYHRDKLFPGLRFEPMLFHLEIFSGVDSTVLTAFFTSADFFWFRQECNKQIMKAAADVGLWSSMVAGHQLIPIEADILLKKYSLGSKGKNVVKVTYFGQG